MLNVYFIDSNSNTTSFRHVSVGQKEVWATTDKGVLLRRQGISEGNPAGTGWDIGIAVRIFFS